MGRARQARCVHSPPIPTWSRGLVQRAGPAQTVALFVPLVTRPACEFSLVACVAACADRPGRRAALEVAPSHGLDRAFALGWTPQTGDYARTVPCSGRTLDRNCRCSGSSRSRSIATPVATTPRRRQARGRRRAQAALGVIREHHQRRRERRDRSPGGLCGADGARGDRRLSARSCAADAIRRGSPRRRCGCLHKLLCSGGSDWLSAARGVGADSDRNSALSTSGLPRM